MLAGAGAIIFLAPGLGARGALLLLAVALLLGAAVGGWRLIRDGLTSRQLAAVASRAAIGMIAGAVVVAGVLLADDSGATTVTLATVLGVGLVLYGLAALVEPLVQRRQGAPTPLGAFATAIGLAVIGALLVVRAAAGVDELDDSLSLLGILLLATGMALTGWSLMLKPQEDTVSR